MTTPPFPVRASGGGGDADLVTYATLLARFAHRFADRAGVLDARGLAEEDFAALESAALRRLQAAATDGDLATLNAFASAIVAGRASLEEAVATSEPTTHAASTRRDDMEDDPVTLTAPPVESAPVGSAPAEWAPAGSIRGVPAPIDLSELMSTLQSEASRRR